MKSRGALERELGVALFVRSSRRVEVTAAGRAFVAAARTSLDAAHRAVSDAASAMGEIRGTLTVGIIPTVTAIDIPDVLGAVHRRHPAVRISLRGGGSDEFVTAIAGGRMDVAVLGLHDTTPPRNVKSRGLAREQLVAVVSADHAFARRRRLRIEELADEEFDDFPEGTSGRIPSDLAFRAAGIRRNVAFEAMSADLMLGLVRNNLAITLLSPAVVPDSDGFRIIPLTRGPTRVEYLAWSDFNPSPAARAFLETVGCLSIQ